MPQLLEYHIYQTAPALDAINEGQSSLAAMLVGNRLALDYLLASQGERALKGRSYFMWVNNIGKSYRRVQQIKQQTKIVNIITKILKEIPWTPLISSPGYLLLLTPHYLSRSYHNNCWLYYFVLAL